MTHHSAAGETSGTTGGMKKAGSCSELMAVAKDNIDLNSHADCVLQSHPCKR